MMQERGLLSRRLRWHEAHARPPNSLTDRRSVRGICLATTNVWLDVGRRYQPHLMPGDSDRAPPMGVPSHTPRCRPATVGESAKPPRVGLSSRDACGWRPSTPSTSGFYGSLAGRCLTVHGAPGFKPKGMLTPEIPLLVARQFLGGHPVRLAGADRVAHP
jgi:hypothetical protein